MNLQLQQGNQNVIGKKEATYVTGFWKTVPNHTTTEIYSIA